MRPEWDILLAILAKERNQVIRRYTYSHMETQFYYRNRKGTQHHPNHISS